ncbi:helix-turn-helix domain-containing protein [Flavobacterium luminosum]|uniref:Helix-turn-helix domain-containing protein n=1 Tax=Flavobacterium luminosum TaxID=2949086 RepID=A0ABT0TR53_9FLAO|nr:helix-turn-helix domain-containing protein [Flavobacterium sp. HXWNR70]MCL9809976.1 helix-turn-helix domain-containing protein [Flavobacterium sp. HXWNR70]
MKSEVDVLKTQVDELLKVVQELQQQNSEEGWYDGADLKQLFSFSDSTLARYRKENRIPFTKLGGRILYPKSYFTKSLMAKMKNKHLL